MTNNTKRAAELAEEIVRTDIMDDITPAILEALNAAQAEGCKQGAESKWLPIESAPKDSRVLVFGEYKDNSTNYKVATVADVDDKGRIFDDYTCTGEVFSDVRFTPTHWMPLPPVPKGEE